MADLLGLFDLEQLVHCATLSAVAFGAAAGGVRCAFSHARSTIYRMAEERLDSIEDRIASGQETQEVRIIHKAMRPVIQDLRNRIDNSEFRIMQRIDRLDDHVIAVFRDERAGD